MKSARSSARLLIAVCTLLFCNQGLSGMGTTLSLVSLTINLCAYECYHAYKNRYPDVGIAPETTVKGVVESFFIGNIRSYDQILGCDDKFITSNSIVMSTHEKMVSRLIQITVEDELILVAPGQVFLCRGAGWIQAHNLKPGDQLACFRGFAVVDDVKVIDVKTTVCTLALDDVYGFYFISRHEILTYNFTLQKIWEPAKWVGEKFVLPAAAGIVTVLIQGRNPK